MMINLKQYAENVREKIENAQKIVITSHLNPDGDAIGSGLGLMNLLKNAGKTVNFVIPNEAPEFLKWMKSADEIMVYHKNPKKVAAFLSEADLIIYVDFNDLMRLGDASSLFEASDLPSVLIDHHPEPRVFADVCISETQAGSASEIVFELIKEMGFLDYMDVDIAECFYTGIMTDTGNFSFACSYPGVWKNVGELVSYSINRDDIYARVYDTYTESRTRLMGFCLHEKLMVLPEFHTAIITLSDQELKSFNYKPGDTEGFVNIPFSIKGIRFTVLMIEKKDHIKLSLRSRGKFSVNEFARKHFSGGGHTNAAGGEYPKPLSSAVEKFISLLDEYKEDLS